MIDPGLLIHKINLYTRNIVSNPYGETEEELSYYGQLDVRVEVVSHELTLYAEGEFILGTIKIFANSFPLSEGDYVEWNNRKYKVIQIKPCYSDEFSHYEVLAIPQDV